MLANKVVLVTGGSSGIGAAAVKLFAKEGASVAFVGRNEAKLKEVESRCQQHGANVLAIRADVSKDEEVNTIVQQTVDKFGKLDVLVNNAGIVRYASILEPNLMKKFDEVMNTNLRSVVHLTNLAAPHLVKTKGNIVNISSVVSKSIKVPGIMCYSVSKAGLDHFTRAAALELAPSGVRVNAINPGPVVTDIISNSDLSEEQVRNANPAAMTVTGRSSDADEIGDLILYLASDKARSVTGSCYVIDNGYLLK